MSLIGTGYTTYYSYDSNGNLTLVDYPNGPDFKFTYNALNQVTGDCVAGGITNLYTYTLRGQLLTETVNNWASSMLTLGYNADLRNSLTLTQPSIGSWTQGYQYDSGKRLTNLTSSSGTFPYSYSPAAGVTDAASRLIARIGVPVTTATASITNLYDSLGRMTNTALYGSGGTLTNRHGYLYNPAHQITQQTRTDGGYVTYTYDDGGELLTGSTFTSGGTAVPTENFGYAYDGAQNMIRRTNNAATTTYPVNALNQVTGGLSTFSYDRKGNRTSSSNYETFVSDDEKQRVQHRYEPPRPGLKTDFVYDAKLRLRIRREYTGTPGSWALQSETRYLYDGMRVIQERNVSNVPQVTYTRGLDMAGGWQGAGGIGGLLARTAHSGATGATYAHAFYHADRGGNVTYLLNADNSLGATYKYDPSGKALTSSGALASANVYRFSSKELCSASGLYYYGYRFYDSLTQRWLNRDPLWEQGGINLYQFARNAAVNFYDTDGRQIDGAATPGIGGVLMTQGELAAIREAAQAAAAAAARSSITFCPQPNGPKNPCEDFRKIGNAFSQNPDLERIRTAVSDIIKARGSQEDLSAVPGLTDGLRRMLADMCQSAADCFRSKKDPTYNDERAKFLRGERSDGPGGNPKKP